MTEKVIHLVVDPELEARKRVMHDAFQLRNGAQHTYDQALMRLQDLRLATLADGEQLDTEYDRISLLLRSSRDRTEISEYEKMLKKLLILQQTVLKRGIELDDELRSLRYGENPIRIALHHTRRQLDTAISEYTTLRDQKIQERDQRIVDQRIRIARFAGVPEEYLSTVRMRMDSLNAYHLFFGGDSEVDGELEKHAHYVVYPDKQVWHRHIGADTSHFTFEVEQC